MPKATPTQRAAMLAEHHAKDLSHGFHPDDCSACQADLRLVMLGLEADLRRAAG